ncbi:membrane-associated PAP2 superfamily phosphatase [Streptosporangium album]|uniref:Membrane-associated PAP2 superfamily phosphatase n=1 Tax=Streptosporangium album TaxID=47479 RepID=A0A7W7RUN2_9ACTN|nr:hypothetical protein [Streptosporangium album]MBB4938554.1 membrane-associated PAP2 superfamily phosphatase [Streptosporangium album]
MPTPRFFPMLRVALALQTAALLIQAITAGLLLSTPGGRAMHSISSAAVVATALLYLVAAILVRRPGGGLPRMIVPAVAMVVFVLVQAMLGVAHMKALHVPLGVLMFGGSVMQLVRVWSRPQPVVAVTT